MKDITKELEVRIEQDESGFCYIWLGKKNGDMLGHTSTPLKEHSSFKKTLVKLFFMDSPYYKLEVNEKGEFKILG